MGMGVAVIGAGLMGHGIAQVFAAAGQPVSIYDPDPETLASVPERIAANLRDLGQGDTLAVESVRLVESIEDAVAGVDWVIEAAPEALELKQGLFAELDRVAEPHVVLASNSSVMRVRDIAAKATGRDRIVGTHWWNPPYLVPLVEVIQGPESDPAIVDRTLTFLRGIGRTAVHVRRDIPGFVGNRLQHALWREAFDLIDRDVCDAETVDLVVKEGFGRRLGVLGPVENADLIGLDLTLAIHEYILPSLSTTSHPSVQLRHHVDSGELGMSTGSGFRRWSAEDIAAIRARVSEALSKR